MATRTGIIEGQYIRGIDHPKFQREQELLGHAAESRMHEFLEGYGKQFGIIEGVAESSSFDDQKIGIDRIVKFVNGFELAVDFTVSRRVEEGANKLKKILGDPIVRGLHDAKGRFSREAHMPHVFWRGEAEDWQDRPGDEAARRIFHSFISQAKEILSHVAEHSPTLRIEDKKLLREYVDFLESVHQEFEKRFL